MFIEVTSKGQPLLISTAEIIMVGIDSKKNTFIVTANMDAVVVEETYDAVKERLAVAFAN
jgi:DNA-binding LytR/AlgR family response regulator